MAGRARNSALIYGEAEGWQHRAPRYNCRRCLASTVNGVSLYYEVTGDGPPLVLAHGFACGLRMWDPQVNALARSWRVVTYDVRGHGISEAPDDPAAYSQPISVADLRALLEHLRFAAPRWAASRWAGTSRSTSRSPTRRW